MAGSSAGNLERAGVLFIVSTPIGNPEDISLRAIRVLREVALIAAEDANITRKLLHHYGIFTEVTSSRSRRGPISMAAQLYCAANGDAIFTETCGDDEAGGERNVTERIRALLTSGHSVALVCDVGTPTLADPGYRLVSSALAWGVDVIAVPGASAALTALVVSGLPTGRCTFDGFPPRARADRHAFFVSLRSESRTIILYETRRYLRSTLQTLSALLSPEHQIAVARNLTTGSETVIRGTLSEVQKVLLPDPPRGEYVLILAPPMI